MVIPKARKESLDQLAITKAAAWAWYERGSWLEHKSIRETDCKRTQDNYTPKPSRYKLEAMKKLQKENNETKPRISNSSLCNKQGDHNSLLDVYEIERISRKLDYYQRKSVDGGDHGGGRIMLEGIKSKKKGISKKPNGLWIQHGLMCRSGKDDVVEHGNLAIRGRRRQQK